MTRKASAPLQVSGKAAISPKNDETRSFLGGEKCQPACKPGSVWPLASRTGTWRPFILGAHRCAPHATYPDGWAGNSPEGFPSHRPYSVLLPVGFAVPLPLPVARWALTSPFHPCHASPEDERGGLLSVALSLGSPPPAVSRHRVSMEPGLSSSAVFRPSRMRPPGRLAGRIKGFARQNANEKAGAGAGFLVSRRIVRPASRPKPSRS